MKHPKLDPCRRDLAERVCAVLEGEAGSWSLSVDEVGRMLAKPPQANMGDYALPCFRFAKTLGKKPNEVAELLCQQVSSSHIGGWLVSVETAGAFLNFRIDQKQLASYVVGATLNGDYFRDFQSVPEKAGETVMIEYSQPNTHKLFHVGHLRNVCLGHSLTRLFRYCGYKVIPVNYIGDEGTHIAECLWHVSKSQESAPAGESERVAWLESHYAAAKQELADAGDEEKAKSRQEIAAVLAEFEARSGSFYDQWIETKQWCMDEFYRIYAWLKVEFEHFFYESEMTDDAQAVVDQYLEKGLFIKDQGAIGINLEDDKLGFLILRKSNGTVPYATRDLALAAQKFEKYDVKRSVYIVANEQRLHFQQVFKTLEKMGFERAADCFHLSYAFVRIPGGKMSTRKGNAIHFSLLQDKLEEAFNDQLEKSAQDWSNDEKNDVLQKLSVGSIMYGMLRTDPLKEIIFDLPEWTAFEGDTGPYLMYSYARARSILRKLDENVLAKKDIDWSKIEHPAEFALLRYIYDLNDAIASACENYRPSALASQLFNMCKELNRVYAAVRVNDPDQPEATAARAKLLEAFCAAHKQGLYLLGIEPPERM